MALRKWFTGKPKTVERGAQNLRQYCEWIGKTPEELKADSEDYNPELTRMTHEELEKAYSPNQQSQPTEPYNPLLEHFRQQHEEGKAEVERINKLPQNKINRWLNEPEQE